MNKVKIPPKEKAKEMVSDFIEENLTLDNSETSSAKTEITTEVPRRKKKSTNKFLKALNVFGLIEKDILIKVMPFVFFLTGIALIYIANSYYAERTIRDIDRAAKDIKELRSEYISTKSDLMFKSNQSQVAVAAIPSGLKESRTAPKKIVVTNPSTKKSN
jgi:hypothetical protein